MPVQFWDRDIDQHDRTNPHRGPKAWNPEGAPDPEQAEPACRPWHPRTPDRDAYDLLRDEQALDPFGEGMVGGQPAEDLESLAAHTSAARTGTSSLEPRRARPEARPSARFGATSSRDKSQPGRGHDRAA